MKKYIKYIVIVLLAITINTGYRIRENNKKVRYLNFYSDISTDIDIDKVSLEQLRQDYPNDLQDLKDGKYINLSINNPYIYITREDVLYNISEKSNTGFKDMSLHELAEKELEVIKSLIGDDINTDYIFDNTSFYYLDENYEITENYDLHYPTYEETLESIRNNTYTPNKVVAEYCTWPCLTYDSGLSGDSNVFKYCHVSPDMDYVIFKRESLCESLGVLEDHMEGNPDYVPIKTYYKTSPDLDDEYKLSNGTISVRKAIDFVEQYFSNLYPYNIFPENKEFVHHVSVFDLQDGICAMEFALTKEFGGLITETERPGEADYTEVRNDTRVTMVETDNVDMRTGSGNGLEMHQIGDGITKVVSLKSALEIISSNIGKNSKYEINEISMIFRRKIYDQTSYRENYLGIPHWLIRCKNVADGKEISFYVNLVNGKMEYKGGV